MIMVEPSSSSSSSSSFTWNWIYDVFLSFRGEDTRNGFTSNLYHALDQKGIHTFIDDEELQKGEEITPALVKAIQESRIAIVVFSKNYASSAFCLDELAKILELLKLEGRLVWPIFYDVDPSDVRHQKGSYAGALAKHEERFQNDDNGKVQKWRNALREAANLSGSHFKPGSLMKIDKNNNCVRMHDLIQDMGREIVRRESTSKPGKRSRLWNDEDIVHVLENDMGSDRVEVIILHSSKRRVNWNGKAFKKMRNLKVLIFWDVHFSVGPDHLPNSLRVLEWDGYPSPSLPSDFHPTKLFMLNLCNSSLKLDNPLQISFKMLATAMHKWVHS
ncbi:disease resistance-like protein DSC1 isoform X2 [Arachis hypogaea]|uniref:disease resistance-like protein DSC1 isoform X2 n=1 Tax=Arachis hypogaea TaxID=3818 RepID=UPI003B22594F|nr:TMV resistance protein N [Arachis hypogaea]